MAEIHPKHVEDHKQRNERINMQPHSGHPGVMIEEHPGHDLGPQDPMREGGSGGSGVHSDGKTLVDPRISNNHVAPC